MGPWEDRTDTHQRYGSEVVVGFANIASGAIGFQHWSHTGTTLLGGLYALRGEFTNPVFKAVRGTAAGTDHVLIGAKMKGGSPVIQVRDGTGAVQFGKFIFNPDVGSRALRVVGR